MPRWACAGAANRSSRAPRAAADVNFFETFMDDLSHNTTVEPVPFTALAATTYEYHGLVGSWHTACGRMVAMKRLAVLIALAGFLLTGLAVAAQQGYTVTGKLGATDQEAQEGYFAIDNQTMIVVKPGSDLHAYLRGRVGQRVRVTIETDSGSN
jgi:hypothetical protein